MENENNVKTDINNTGVNTENLTNEVPDLDSILNNTQSAGYCSFCGALIEAGSSFCGSCGAKQNPEVVATENSDKNEKTKNAKKKSRKSTKIIIAAIIVVCIAAAGVIFGGHQIKKSIAINTINSTKESYIAKTVSADEALEKIKKYESDTDEEVASSASETVKAINILKTSRENYTNGMSKAEAGEYFDAILLFNKVDKSDPDYDSAVKKIEELKTEAKQQAIKEIDTLISENKWTEAQNKVIELQAIISDDEISAKRKEIDDGKAAYEAEQERLKIEKLKNEQQVYTINPRCYDEGNYLVNKVVTAGVVNNSDKVVKDYALVFLLFDANGYPVNPDYSMYADSRAENSLCGKAETVNILPGKTESNYHYYWGNYNLSDRTAYTKACIREVTFTDGTTWDNPYFAYWIESEKDRY